MLNKTSSLAVTDWVQWFVRFVINSESMTFVFTSDRTPNTGNLPIAKSPPSQDIIKETHMRAEIQL